MNWVATQPFGRAYDHNISFPPVMVYIWAALAAIEPAFRSTVDASDPWIRVLMKVPASIADFGLAAAVAYALRDHAKWAVAGAVGILIHPAVIDVSAWWGQYESIYVLGGLAAYLMAIAGRPHVASIFLAVALMTKPQALPFVVPFAAWFLAIYGIRRSFVLAGIGLATIVVLWLPFLPAGGPAAYLSNLSQYQGEVFAVLSLRAWNPWWLVQEAYGRGEFIADGAAIAGPMTFRLLGILAAISLEGIVFLAVLRAPTRRSLALGLTAATLVAFIGLTTMHERYSYASIIFLALLIPDRRVLALWLALSIVVSFNLLAAAPPTTEVARLLPIFGPFGVAGSIAVIAVAAGTLVLLTGEAKNRQAGLMRPRLSPGASG
jgi:Gpi18-like mannosyltransferase